MVAAITLWNTACLDRALAALRQHESIDPNLLPHLAPIGWNPSNLTGDWSERDDVDCERPRFSQKGQDERPGGSTKKSREPCPNKRHHLSDNVMAV